MVRKRKNGEGGTLRKRLSIAAVFIIIFTGLLAGGYAYYKTAPSSQSTGSILQPLGLKISADIPLTGNSSRFDGQDIDYKNQRLYLTHLGDNAVTVFDLQTNKVIADVKNGLDSPHDLLVIPSSRRVYVSMLGNVAVVDGDTLQILKFVPVGTFPDSFSYSPETRKLFLADIGGGVAVIDTTTNRFLENIGTGGQAGYTAYDPTSKSIFATAEKIGGLFEIDPVSDRVVAKYELSSCEGAHGFVIDPASNSVLIACQNNNRVLMFDLDAQTVVASDSTGESPDWTDFDVRLHRLYVASESGVLSVFQVAKGRLDKIGQGFVANHAHTVIVDQETDRIYMPLEGTANHPILRILEPVLSRQ